MAIFLPSNEGPIIRFSEIADQLRYRTHTFEKFARGVVFFSLGLAKTGLIANPCRFVAHPPFDPPSRHPLQAWTGALAYAFQIYFDFSGYSDMAIGLGLMFGFVFPKNFDSPYRAESITDFWRRWHISLSTWLRDYLYLPLGGNRKGPRRTYLNLAVVMLLGGLWHGASWNFVIWGGLHGVWLAFERALGKRSPYSFLPRPARVMLTFTGVLVTWVFFRTADLNAAVRYLSDMLALGDPRPAGQSFSREELIERLEPYQRTHGLVDDFEVPLGLFLQPCPPRDILARMLRNLKVIHRTAEDWPRLLAVSERLVRLLPTAWDELRDRGLVHAELAHHQQAERDLAGYLAQADDAPDRDAIVARLRDIRRSLR